MAQTTTTQFFYLSVVPPTRQICDVQLGVYAIDNHLGEKMDGLRLDSMNQAGVIEGLCDTILRGVLSARIIAPYTHALPC